MLERIILFTAIIGGAYWYWSGPYQDKINPGYEAILKQNHSDMSQCTRAAAYKAGATGSGPGPEGAEAKCAEKFNVYKLDGQWHRYDMSRLDE